MVAENSWVSDVTIWYSISFVIFVVALYRPLKGIINKALEDKSAEIRRDLEEAKQLREQAVKMVEQARLKQKEAEQNAIDIIKHAKNEVVRIQEAATDELEVFMRRQNRNLETRIKQMEIAAIKSVNDRMIEIAIETAEEVIASNLDENTAQEIIEHSLKEVKYVI